MYPVPAQCPVCGEEMQVRQVVCQHCHTSIQGEFSTCRFCKLDGEQLKFLELFLRCRGVLSSVERELGISYPTVRARLDTLLSALGLTPEPDRREEIAAKQREILAQLERGEISAEEAGRLLRSVR